jgi:amidohydrolase
VVYWAKIKKMQLSTALIEKVKTHIEQDHDTMFEVFKRLNVVPEILFDLPETTAIVKETLSQVDGLEVHEGIAPSCLVGVMRNGPGPTLAYRFDMDGLPIPLKETDNTHHEWHCRTGNSHSCGHSTHTAIGIAVARAMSRLRSAWSGTFLIYAQSAEEGGTKALGSGAQAMIRNGLFEKYPKPQKLLAIHCEPFIPVGMVRLCKGYAFAHTSFFEMTIRATATHGGMPFKTQGKDSILLAARIINNLQSIVSRELNPLTESAVVSVGSIHGGEAGNAIPSEVIIKGTVRCRSEKIYTKIMAAIRRIANAEAAAMDIQDMPILDLMPVYAPELYNNPAIGDVLENVYKNTIGEGNIILSEHGEFYGEDLSNYNILGGVDIFLTWVGSVSRSKFEDNGEPIVKLPALHDGGYSPYWSPGVVDTFSTGALTQVCGLLELFGM